MLAKHLSAYDPQVWGGNCVWQKAVELLVLQAVFVGFVGFCWFC